MQTLNQFLIEHMASLTWLDLVDPMIVVCIAGYAFYRIESKVNPLVDRVNELTESNQQSLRIIDEQEAEIKALRKKYQAIHYKQVRAEFLDQREWCRDN